METFNRQTAIYWKKVILWLGDARNASHPDYKAVNRVFLEQIVPFFNKIKIYENLSPSEILANKSVIIFLDNFALDNQFTQTVPTQEQLDAGAALAAEQAKQRELSGAVKKQPKAVPQRQPQTEPTKSPLLEKHYDPNDPKLKGASFVEKGIKIAPITLSLAGKIVGKASLIPLRTILNLAGASLSSSNPVASQAINIASAGITPNMLLYLIKRAKDFGKITTVEEQKLVEVIKTLKSYEFSRPGLFRAMAKSSVFIPWERVESFVANPTAKPLVPSVSLPRFLSKGILGRFILKTFDSLGTKEPPVILETKKGVQRKSSSTLKNTFSEGSIKIRTIIQNNPVRALLGGSASVGIGVTTAGSGGIIGIIVGIPLVLGGALFAGGGAISGGFSAMGGNIGGSISSFFTSLSSIILGSFVPAIIASVFITIGSIALILFIINSGAYIVPPESFTEGSGSSKSEYLEVKKEPSSQGPFQNSALPLSITYTITVSAKKGSLLLEENPFTNTCEDIGINGTSPCDSSLPTDFPSVIDPGSPWVFQYTATYGQSYENSIIIDTFTVTAKASDSIKESASGTAIITIGNPPLYCFEFNEQVGNYSEGFGYGSVYSLGWNNYPEKYINTIQAINYLARSTNWVQRVCQGDRGSTRSVILTHARQEGGAGGWAAGTGAIVFYSTNGISASSARQDYNIFLFAHEASHIIEYRNSDIASLYRDFVGQEGLLPYPFSTNYPKFEDRAQTLGYYASNDPILNGQQWVGHRGFAFHLYGIKFQ